MKRRRRGRGRGVADADGGLEGSAPSGSGPVRHIPVLLPEMLNALSPKDGERYIDATFGAGGYACAMLDTAQCEVLALDCDPAAVSGGRSLVAALRGRLTLLQSQFSDLETAARSIGWDAVDGVVFDLGVSSMQLDEAERGFSFMRDGPLDMRMSSEGLSAAEVVNTFAQDEIANILYKFGEERRSRSIAAAIVKDRAEVPFETTLQLAGLVARILGRRHDDAKHPATRTFQALRLFVNRELGELEAGLQAAERLLRPGGRLVVVSFHSLEDRIVKLFLKDRAGGRSGVSRYVPVQQTTVPPSFTVSKGNGIEPAESEVARNPRARSARLRSAVRTDAPSG